MAGGVVDSDDRGELKVIVVNQGNTTKVFEVGDRVAQLVIEKVSTAPLVVTSRLSNTSRGEGGFGSSGVVVRSLQGSANVPLPERESLPEGDPHDRGAQGHEGAAEEDPHDRGALGHEGAAEEGLQDRGVPGHEGGAGGGSGFVHARDCGRVVASGRVPSNIFFETFTSRGGETMQVFLERLRGDELAGFSWLLADCVLRYICNMPLNGQPHEVMVHFPRSVVTTKIHRHGGLRKKLFDSDMSMPPAAHGLASTVVTVAWLENGRKMIRADLRKRESWNALPPAALVWLQRVVQGVRSS